MPRESGHRRLPRQREGFASQHGRQALGLRHSPSSRSSWTIFPGSRQEIDEFARVAQHPTPVQRRAARSDVRRRPAPYKFDHVEDDDEDDED